MKKYVTPKGKTIEVFYSGRNLAVRFAGGGELPHELSGIWTNETELDKSVQKYLSGKVLKNDDKTGQSPE